MGRSSADGSRPAGWRRGTSSRWRASSVHGDRAASLQNRGTADESDKKGRTPARSARTIPEKLPGFRSRLPAYPLFLLEGAVLIAVAAYLFYDSAMAAAFLSPLLIPYYRRRVRERRCRDRKELAEQFREALAAIITALKAGYSAENAFVECRREMQFQFGEKAMITVEMERIEQGLYNRIALEKLLGEFAARWQIEEIGEFAEVFSIARRSGGNLPEILGRTASIIQDRMEIDREIDLLLSSRKYEQKIMAGVPFFIIFYLGVSTEGFFSSLYHNAGGVMFMTGCLAAYIAAILLSDRIMDIEL